MVKGLLGRVNVANVGMLPIPMLPMVNAERVEGGLKG